jgi:amidohydrolase
MNRTAFQKILFDHFTWFHENPELSFAEHETTRRIKAVLEEWGVEILPLSLETGLVALIAPKLSRNGGEKMKTIAIRADIDALAIQEETGLPYSSKKSGRMHACGHDFHITALLGCAALLRETREERGYAVKLIFQPAEERSQGARKIIDTGVLDDVEAIYGLHVHPELETGTVAVSEGSAYAGVALFKITVRGKGGHAGIPQATVDPVILCAQIIQSAQTIISRNTDPFAPAVLSVTHVEAGSAWNIIPEKAFLEGTIRAFDSGQMETISDSLKKICAGIALASGAEINAAITELSPPTNNDGALTKLVIDTVRGLGYPLVPSEAKMIGEDFALYQKKIPGVFLQFGVSSPGGLHSPQFTADASGLSRAAELLYEIAVRSLKWKKKFA